jgi:ABC-2 type transport system permease protein
MNWYAVRAIYVFEMARMGRTLFQSIVSPVISTSLYFVVFGAAIGSRITEIDGVSYGSFIVPGLIMLSLLTESVSNASFGIYFPKYAGSIFELLSAPVSFVEIVLGYVGAAASKSIILGCIILTTANLFVDITIAHPVWMVLFLVLTAVSFSLFGFILGIWADNWEKLAIVPTLVTLFNPVVYLISGFRWSFYENADVAVGLSLATTSGFLIICLIAIWLIFRTGYRVRV